MLSTALVIGLLVCALVLLWGTRAETSAWAAVNFFVTLSGIYYPVSVLPGWVQTISAGIPLTYFLDGIRAGYGFPPRFAHPFAIGFALSILYAVLAHWALAAAVTHSPRTGLLLSLSSERARRLALVGQRCWACSSGSSTRPIPTTWWRSPPSWPAPAASGRARSWERSGAWATP